MSAPTAENGGRPNTTWLVTRRGAKGTATGPSSNGFSRNRSSALTATTARHQKTTWTFTSRPGKREVGSAPKASPRSEWRGTTCTAVNTATNCITTKSHWLDTSETHIRRPRLHTPVRHVAKSTSTIWTCSFTKPKRTGKCQGYHMLAICVLSGTWNRRISGFIAGRNTSVMLMGHLVMKTSIQMSELCSNPDQVKRKAVSSKGRVYKRSNVAHLETQLMTLTVHT